MAASAATPSVRRPPARAVRAAWIFALAFAAAGVVGFLPNPLLGPRALFMTNAAHNLVHLATGVGFAAVAWAGERPSLLFMRGFGVVYLAVGALGFATLGSAAEGRLLGLVHINQADNLLHLALGATILAAGILLVHRSSRTLADAA